MVVLLIGCFSLAISDIRYKSVSVIHILIVAAVSVLSTLIDCDMGRSMFYKMLGGLISGTILFVILSLSGLMGKADGIMFIVTGCVTGFITMIQVFIVAITILSIYAAVLLISHKIQPKQEIPFLPFLFLSLLGVTLCG